MLCIPRTQKVKGPSGKEYVIGCGMYDAKMEKKFVAALVEDAVALIRNVSCRAPNPES